MSAPDEQDGKVVPLHRGATGPGPAEVDGPVIEGELVDDEPRQAATVPARRLSPPVRAVAELVRAERTQRAGWSTVRAVVATAQGVESWGRRAWDASTMGVYRRAIRTAEAAGDREALAEWVDRREHAVERRHKRLMDMPQLAAGIAKVSLGSLAAVVFLVLVAGLVAQLTGGRFADVVLGFLNALAWSGTVIAATWTPLVALAPLVVLLAAWREGIRRQEPPRWLARHLPGHDTGGAVVTADGIVQALTHLGVPAISRALKDGWIPRFELPPVRDGNGFRTIFELPLGATPDMIADKRAVLARNLHRAEVEVWPSDSGKATGGRAGYVDMWVADAGTLSKPAPAYPLLHSGTADIFAGVPVGVSQRGDEITFPLVEANFVFGGMMGQGKSNGCRVVMLGAALDPLAQLWVHVFAGNGDFDAYAPRLAVYRRGATGDVIESGVESLRALYEEVGRREARLSELGAKKLTRDLVTRHPDLRPIVSLYSECHELFGSREHGEEAADYAAQTIRRGRKTGVILGFDTQSSRKDAIPPKIVELVRLNACFAVKSWRSNDGFLGDGSFAAGVRATELRPGKDRGTCLVTGLGDEAFEIVKTYYIEADDDAGTDAATDVIARTNVDIINGGAEPERPDLLADVHEVLAGQDTRASWVADRLRDRPGYGSTATGSWLVDRLHREHRIEVRRLDGHQVVRVRDIAAALASREVTELDPPDQPL